jgi:hypothetical protein
MSRGVRRRLLGAALVCAVTGGCAVNNPTDLAQRRPKMPEGSGTPAITPSYFKPKAAVRILARLGYGDARPKTVPPGPLRGFLASCRGATTPCSNVFLFYRDRYIGAAFAQPRSQVAVTAQDGALVRVRYTGRDGGIRYIRYIWDGATVVGLTGTGSRPVVRKPDH